MKDECFLRQTMYKIWIWRESLPFTLPAYPIFLNIYPMCHFFKRTLDRYNTFRSISRKSLSFTDVNELSCVKQISVQVDRIFQVISELLPNLFDCGFNDNDSYSKQWCSECSWSSIVCFSSRQLFTLIHNKQFSIEMSSLNLIGCVRLLFCNFSFFGKSFSSLFFNCHLPSPVF